MDLRANTAVDVLIGPFIDKTDGNTTEDALTLTQAEIKLSKNGQALAQKSDVTSAAFDDDGYYNCELDATDTNTEGQLVVIIHQSANALPVRHEYNIMAEAAWDSLYVAKDAGFMDVNIKTIGRADAQETEADNLETATANYSATRGLTGTAVPAAAANAAGGVPISAGGGLALDAMNTNINDIKTDTNEIQGKLPTNKFMGSSDGADDDANIAAILVDTAEIGAAGAGLTDLGGMSTGMKAEVQTEVEGGLEDAGQVMVITTIATLASQTGFTLTAGSADDDAYNKCFIIVEDASTAAQKAVGYISNYTGATKTIALISDPGIFTMAATDKVTILPRSFTDLLAATQTSIDAIETDTNEIQGKLPTNKFMGSSDGADDDANIAAILVDTNELQADWTDAGRLDAILDLIKTETDKLGDAMPDSIAADGSINTPIQALYFIQQFLTEFAISSTTYTAKKVDGSTSLATFTLDDATTPTSLTRAT